MKHRFLFIMALLLTAATGAWADDDPAPIELTKNTDGTVWTLSAMPGYDVELEVTYKTDLTLTVSLSGWTYGGTANTPTVTGNEGSGTVTYNYKKKDADDETYSADVPTDAGIYTIRATVAETDDYADGVATADFTIAAADIAATDITAPTANTLNFTGLAQELIVAGSVAGGIGTMQYSLDGTNWSTDIPTGTAKGDYTVYYKVVGDGNHNDVAAQSFKVTIGEALDIDLTSTDGKVWTYTQLAYDVELEMEYYPAAILVDGTDQAPAVSADPVYASTEAPLFTAGTASQGTLMYAVTTNDVAPTTTAGFTATVPTAQSYTEPTTLYAWYYIQGSDAGVGGATATYSNSEVLGPLTVTVFNNKFNITFNAANANTIESGKATVKVGDAAATVTEGKLEGVKMESKATLTAKEGYKIKSVTVKKTGAEETVTVTTNEAKTEASFDMPTNDVTVTYELIRDMTVAVSAKVGDGTDGCRFSIYKKEGGTYDLVDDAADYPEIMDNIDAKNPAEVAAKDYELQLQKLGDDGKTWANTADYSPGTFRQMVTGKEGYDGTIYTNTYVLYEQTSITFAKGYSTHYYTESLVLDEKQDGLKFYAVTAVTDEKVTLTEIEAKGIPAETPFIAYNAGAEAVTAKMGLLKADDVTSAEEFKGTAEDKTMAAQSGCYVLRNGDSTPTFRLVEGAGTLPAHRCWIELGTSSSARVLNVEFDGNKTAISIISVDVDNAGDWYNLQGHKLQGAPQRKGTYIHNGKTIIIK